jgi:hypothetical protein
VNRPAIHAFKWFSVVCFFLSVVMLTFAIEQHVSGLIVSPNPYPARIQQLREHFMVISISAIPSAMFGILYILCIHTLRMDELLKK